MGIEQVERRRVAWIDTDAGGRIHFTAAFRYAEAAETELMRSVGLLGGEWVIDDDQPGGLPILRWMPYGAS